MSFGFDDVPASIAIDWITGDLIRRYPIRGDPLRGDELLEVHLPVHYINLAKKAGLSLEKVFELKLADYIIVSVQEGS